MELSLSEKIQGSVNVHFQMYRSSNAPITGSAFINLEELLQRPRIFSPARSFYYIQKIQHNIFPALLENFSLQIPQTSLNAMSTMYYTYGDIQGYPTGKDHRAHKKASANNRRIKLDSKK